MIAPAISPELAPPKSAAAKHAEVDMMASSPTIFKQNVKKNSKLRPFNEIISDVGDIQYFPAWSKEWRNSVYHYNSNLIKNFPVYDINIVKIIKSYFNTYFNHQFLKYKYIRPKIRRLSFNKIFFGKPEIKHTNSKAMVTLYTFNREKSALFQKIMFLEHLYKLFKMLFKTGGYVTFKRGGGRPHPLALALDRRKIKRDWGGGFWSVNQALPPLGGWGYGPPARVFFSKKPCLGFLANFEKLFFKFNIITAILKDKNLLLDFYAYLYALNRCKSKAKQQTNKLFKLEFKREISFLRKYKFKLNLNKYKFEGKFLFRLSNIISKIYSKQIEFNIVNLKNLVFNADLFTEISTLKIKKKKTRAEKIMNIMLNKAKLPIVNRIQEKGRIVKNVDFNLVENKYRTVNLKDILSSWLNLDKLLNKLYGGGVGINPTLRRASSFLPQTKAAKLYNIVFNSIKYKNMAGIRMEVRGRLTPRYRADRSVYKLRWKGGLKNIYSSYHGLPVRKNRGHLNPNVGYSIFSSKRRVGAFAVKGWMSCKSFSTIAHQKNNLTLATESKNHPALNSSTVTGAFWCRG